MLKPIERVHIRRCIVQPGATCFMQLLTAAYRTLEDKETGLKFCMMMYWSPSGYESVKFEIHKTDQSMHDWFEDPEPDDAESVEDDEEIELGKDVLESPVYKRVYAQLFKAMKKLTDNEGFILNEDLTTVSKEG